MPKPIEDEFDEEVEYEEGRELVPEDDPVTLNGSGDQLVDADPVAKPDPEAELVPVTEPNSDAEPEESGLS